MKPSIIKIKSYLLRASCLTLEINEFRCYEAKIEESEKAGSRRESNPGHLWLEPPVLCHWATTAGQPPALTILYCTACIDGILNASVVHLVATQYVPSELH